MRTRSQPLSPGGLQSLETVSVPRRTRISTTTASSNISSNAEQGPSNPRTAKKSQRKIPTRQRAASQNDPSVSFSPATQDIRNVDIFRVSPTMETDSAQYFPAHSPRSEAITSEASAVNMTPPGVSPGEDLPSHLSHVQPIAGLPTMGSLPVPRFGREASASASPPRCPCCSVILICPNGHRQPVVNILSPEARATKPTKATKKRTIRELTSSDDDAPRTPKRRVVDRPGSIPFPQIPTRGKPYSERRHRREMEAQGRIHSTLLRLPELVAQTEADARARAEDSDNDDGLAADHPAPSPASPPINPRLGWRLPGIFSRNLFPSLRVPSLSFLAGSPSPRQEQPTLNGGGDSASPPVQASGVQILPVSETLQPSTVDDEAASSRLPGTDASKEKKWSQRKVRQPTYSLFPEPIDRELYLRNTSTARSRLGTSDSQPLDKTTKAVDDTETPSDERRPKAGAEAPHSGEESRKSERKRRRRRASPDIIPNPPGTSYGMDLRYFIYSSESYDDSSEDEVRARPSQMPVRGILQTKRPRPKRVHFAASPPDKPSKLRSISQAATESYAGHDMDPHVDRLGVLASPAQMPTSSLRAAQTDPDSYQPVVPNLTGTFTLDYDLFSSDDSDTAAPFETGARVPGPHALSSAPAPGTVAGTVGEPAPSGPSGSNVLRTSEPAPLGADSEGSPLHFPAAANAFETSRRSSMVVGDSAIGPDQEPPSQERLRALFGEDEIGEDSIWAFNQCPSGDFRRISWPEPNGYAESLNMSSEAVNLVNSMSQGDVSAVYDEFCRSIDEGDQIT
ncbi:hypothetical protein V8E54_013437 [Elaphomyces granulatus]